MRLLTSSGGVVQPRAVAAVQALISDEVAAGFYDPPADPARSRTRSCASRRRSSTTTPRSGSAAITSALREVQAALLGVGRPRRVRAARAQTT